MVFLPVELSINQLDKDPPPFAASSSSFFFLFYSSLFARHLCTAEHTHTHTHAHTHTHTHARTHAHTHTHTQGHFTHFSEIYKGHIFFTLHRDVRSGILFDLYWHFFIYFQRDVIDFTGKGVFAIVNTTVAFVEKKMSYLKYNCILILFWIYSFLNDNDN